MNVSIKLNLLDGVTAPIKKIATAVYGAGKVMEKARLKIDTGSYKNASQLTQSLDRAGLAAAHYKERSEGAFESAHHIHQSAEALSRFAERSHALVEKVVQPFEQFEDAMARVRGAVPTTEAEFKNLSAAARGLGASGRFNATEMAEALGGLRQEGMSAAEAIAALPSVANAAVVANKTLGDVIGETTSVMDSFGLGNDQMTRVLDLVAATAPVAGTSIENINASLAELGRDAASSGISLERMAELTGLLATKSIEGARAGGLLGVMLKVLKNPGTEQAQIFKQMGVALTEGSGALKKMRDPLVIMTELQDKMNKSGVSAAGQLHAMSVLFPRAESDVNALLDAAKGDGLAKLTEAIENSTGRVKEMADVMRETGAESARNLKGAWGELGNVLGESMAPRLEETSKRIEKVVRGVTSWLKENPALAKTLGVMLTAVASVTAVMAGLTTLLAAGVAAKGLLFLAAGTTKFAVALAPLAGAALPILAIAAAFAAVTLAVVQLAGAWDTLNFGESWQGLKEALGDGSFFKTMTLNPFSGLGGDSAPTAALGPASNAHSAAAPLSAGSAPRGLIEVKIDSEGKPAIKKVQADGGVQLDVSAGHMMAAGG